VKHEAANVSRSAGIWCLVMLGLAGCTGSNDGVAGVGAPVSATSTIAVETIPPPLSNPASTSIVPDVAPSTHPEVRTRSSEVEGDGVRPEGFTTITGRITSAEGVVCDVCLWLADDGEERARGLMGVTDLGEPVGMAFVWDAPINGRFYMFSTPTPLSIAWFEPGGVHLNETDMAPCVNEDASTCERYGPGGSYDLAIEMFEGELGVVGIEPGARVELLDGSEAPECSLVS
jgi:uncharacterized protein